MNEETIEKMRAAENALCTAAQPSQAQAGEAVKQTWLSHKEAVSIYKEIRAHSACNPIGFIEQDEMEKLGDPEFAAIPESHVRLWHAANPPSRALIPVYTTPPASPVASNENKGKS